MLQAQPNLPPELAAISQVRIFVRPLTRAEFDHAVELLGGKSAFRKPRRYGIWLKDAEICLYPPAHEDNIPPALAAMRRR